MKSFYTFCLFLSALFIVSIVNAQEKEDLLEALEIVLEVDDIRELYQHEIQSGRTLILRKPNGRSLGRGPSDQLQNMIYDLRNEDFQYFSNPVQIMDDNTAQAYDIPARQLTNIGLSMGPTEIKIILSGYLWESRSDYQALFTLIRESEDDDWELENKNFNKRRSN